MAFEIDNTVLNANALVVQENRFLIRSACDVDADFARATDDSVTVAVGVMIMVRHELADPPRGADCAERFGYVAIRCHSPARNLTQQATYCCVEVRDSEVVSRCCRKKCPVVEVQVLGQSKLLEQTLLRRFAGICLHDGTNANLARVDHLHVDASL